MPPSAIVLFDVIRSLSKLCIVLCIAVLVHYTIMSARHLNYDISLISNFTLRKSLSFGLMSIGDSYIESNDADFLAM